MASAFLTAIATLTLLFADPFQFVYVSGTQSFNVAYSLVRVLGPDGKKLLEARTDRYGRVTLDLPAGTYDAESTDGTRTLRFKITVAGSKSLTRVELK